ncbi:MAG: hypothetical protein H6591_05915 [Flavobacteriales bacterium]|nr:hypothetical protein [Flavobacteriales bacterium]
MKKSTAQATLREMPAEFNLDQFLEKLLFIEQVEKGLTEIDAGKGVPHDKVVASVKRKWRK